MRPAQEPGEIARALSAALEPLIDLCLRIGITSPEIESLLRVAFVQRAFVKLPRHARTGRGPSDSRVSLAAGVHRSEVSKIRSAGGTTSAKGTMEKKQALYSKSARVLKGWSTDPRFLTSAGAPSDLPMERNRERRSFQDLVEKYAPGNHPGSVLKELKRRGNVELLAEDLVRYKTPTPRASGVSRANVTLAARRLKRLGDTLFHTILDPENAHLYAETKPLILGAREFELVRAVLERRAMTFLAAVESEFETRSETESQGASKRMGVSVYSWEEE